MAAAEEEGNVPELRDLMTVLKTVDWHSLGIQLGIEKSTLDEIDGSYEKKEKDRKRSDMFECWLDMEEYPTWEMIIKALERIGNQNKAIRTIKKDLIASKPASKAPMVRQNSKPSAPNYSKPTLPLLERFEDLKILERIGADYKSFGIQLLADDTGAIVSAIEKKCQHDPTDIKQTIVGDWIKGKGIPATWDSLVEVLRGMDKNVLAKDIVEKLKTKGITVS